MIHIIDYGVGNIQAFINMFRRIGVECRRASSLSDLDDVSHLILPGVGSFDYAMDQFNQSGMRERVEELVFEEKTPIIGICVGMQMLACSSDEGEKSGLGWIPGTVKAFSNQENNFTLPTPHMGWNELNIRKNHKLLKDFEEKPLFYFLHSYYFSCDEESDVLASASYGIEFGCVVNRNNIYGIQCHPEKSHSSGEILLKSFLEL